MARPCPPHRDNALVVARRVQPPRSLRGGRNHAVLARRAKPDAAISRVARRAASAFLGRGDCFGPAGLAMTPILSIRGGRTPRCHCEEGGDRRCNLPSRQASRSGVPRARRFLRPFGPRNETDPILPRRAHPDEAISRLARRAASASRGRGECFGPSGLARTPILSLRGGRSPAEPALTGGVTPSLRILPSPRNARGASLPPGTLTLPLDLC